MDAVKVDSPFDLSPIDDVRLAATPLVSVLFQVRFPGKVSRIATALDTHAFHRALADSYPYADEQQGMEIVLVAGQPPTVKPGAPVWTWRNESQKRTASITPDSVSLTVEDYVSRDDFTAAVSGLLSAVAEVAPIPQASRIGVRYINRVLDDDALADWIASLAHGARGILAATDVRDAGIQHSLSQVIYRYPDAMTLQAKWGLLASGSVVDPVIEPVSQRSWVLDVDCFHEGDQPFDVTTIAEAAKELARRSYTFFRWVVTPESMARFKPEGV